MAAVFAVRQPEGRNAGRTAFAGVGVHLEQGRPGEELRVRIAFDPDVALPEFVPKRFMARDEPLRTLAQAVNDEALRLIPRVGQVRFAHQAAQDVEAQGLPRAKERVRGHRAVFGESSGSRAEQHAPLRSPRAQTADLEGRSLDRTRDDAGVNLGEVAGRSDPPLDGKVHILQGAHFDADQTGVGKFPQGPQLPVHPCFVSQLEIVFEPGVAHVQRLPAVADRGV